MKIKRKYLTEIFPFYFFISKWFSTINLLIDNQEEACFQFYFWKNHPH